MKLHTFTKRERNPESEKSTLAVAEGPTASPAINDLSLIANFSRLPNREAMNPGNERKNADDIPPEILELLARERANRGGQLSAEALEALAQHHRRQLDLIQALNQRPSSIPFDMLSANQSLPFNIGQRPPVNDIVRSLEEARARDSQLAAAAYYQALRQREASLWESQQQRLNPLLYGNTSMGLPASLAGAPGHMALLNDSTRLQASRLAGGAVPSAQLGDPTASPHRASLPGMQQGEEGAALPGGRATAPIAAAAPPRQASLKAAPASVAKSGVSEEESTKYEATWLERLQELKAFKAQNGHTNVSQYSSNDRRLAGWVKTQRYQKKLLDMDRPSPMTRDRIRMLDAIGFDWNPRPVREDQLWMERYEELREFHRRNGHCMVRQKSETQRKLGLWVTNQRRQYRRMKEGKKSHMTNRRIELLNRIDFEWEPTGHHAKKQERGKQAEGDDEGSS